MARCIRKPPSIVTVAAWVAAVAQVRFLAWECPHVAAWPREGLDSVLSSSFFQPGLHTF